MGTIQTTLRVDADARSAARGLRPLDTALKDVKDSSQDAERALKDIGDRHRIRIDDDQVDRARREITRLRREMRDRLEVDVNADTRDLQRKIGGLRRTIRELERDDIDLRVDVNDAELTRLNRGISGNLGRARSGLAKVGGIAATVGAVVGVATLGVGTVIGKIGLETLKLADDFAQAEIAFTQFLGSAPKADRFLNRLEKFARQTPFEFPELVESSKQLLAFGVDAGDVIGIMTSLGDAAALTGQEVTDLTTIWGQMEAKGRIANEELLQLTERGIPAYQLLADAMGLTVPEVQKLASEGKLLSNNVLPLLQQQMDKTFGGGMAKQAQTLSGLWSTMQDTLGSLGRSLGDAFTPVIAEQIGNLTGKLEEWAEWASENKQAVTVAFSEMAASALDFAADIADAFSGIILASGEMLEAFAEMEEIIKVISPAARVMFRNTDMGEAADRLKSASGEIGNVADGLRTAGDEAIKTGQKWGKAFAKSDAIQATKNDIADLNAEVVELRKRPPTVEVRGQIWRKTKEVNDLNAELKELENAKAVAEIDLDIKEARARRDEIDQALKELNEQEATPQVKADIGKWTAERKKVDAEIAALTQKRNKINLEPEVDSRKRQAAIFSLQGVVKPGGREWRAPMSPEVKGTDAARRSLDSTAKPGGRSRSAPLWIDVTNAGETERRLNALAATRTAVINVVSNVVGSLFGSRSGGTPREMVGPTPEERTTLRTAGSSLAASTPRAMGSTVAYAPGVSVAAGAARTQASGTTRVEPRRTPVAVYLDGVEIADRLATRVSARATSTSMSRRA